MKTSLLLVRADFIGIVRELKQNFTGKILVAIIFLLISGGISAFIYYVSRLFFVNLAVFEDYGRITAEYIINAAVVVIWWIGTASGLAASYTVISAQQSDLVFLVTMPLEKIKLAFYLLVKSVISNFILLLFVFTPIIISFSQVFNIMDIWYFVRSLMVLLALAIMSVSAASPLLYFTVRFIRGNEYKASIGGLILFIAVFWILSIVIFPQELYLLKDIELENFPLIFAELPLNRWWMPSLWAADILSKGSVLKTILLVFSSFGLMLLSVGLWTDMIGKFLFKTGLSLTVKKPLTGVFMKFRYPIFLKDYLSIIRSPNEIGYGLFLTSIALMFFGFLKTGIERQVRMTDISSNLVLFSFSWMSFFASALFLRFLFPLMAKEGKSRWSLFTQPIKKSDIILQKVLLGIVLCLPVFVMSAVLWSLFPVFAGMRSTLNITVILTTLLLAMAHVLLGCVNPNYKDSNNPEKISTSLTGFLTVFVSIIITYGAIIFLKGNI